MCCVICTEPGAGDTAQVEFGQKSETLKPCPFCSSDQIGDIEVDQGRWAVCCSRCGTIGPHCRSPELATARWNSPIERSTETT